MSYTVRSDGMSIVGDHPEQGIRFEFTRAASVEGMAIYGGFAFTPEAKHALRVVMDAAGLVTVEAEATLPKEIAERARMLVRTVVRHAKDGGGRPPLRIRRWRA